MKATASSENGSDGRTTLSWVPGSPSSSRWTASPRAVRTASTSPPGGTITLAGAERPGREVLGEEFLAHDGLRISSELLLLRQRHVEPRQSQSEDDKHQ